MNILDFGNSIYAPIIFIGLVVFLFIIFIFAFKIKRIRPIEKYPVANRWNGVRFIQSGVTFIVLSIVSLFLLNVKLVSFVIVGSALLFLLGIVLIFIGFRYYRLGNR